ncbi:MAG: ATP-binding protein [Solobacterium sp.]|jgi:predicted AAA+ superfamily ATPase|nr:ATP-binding protein [Solobacterium sp.]
MYRESIKDLCAWKQKKNRKPLILEGARQVGKTWLLKEFGRTEYQDTVYINFDSNSQMEQLFAGDLIPANLIEGIELYSGKKIDPSNTLLIFDEIQEVPRALSSLKCFMEEAPEYQIVCAGSLLGIALHSGTSFPVGKVELMNLYSMSFQEFLKATGNDQYSKVLEQKNVTMLNAFGKTYEKLLKQYYFVGGMPEAVQAFARDHDYGEVRTIQQNILNAYDQDISKHTEAYIISKIRAVFQSVPSQLAKENKKFVYGLIRDGARAKDYEKAIMWLTDCGILHKVSRITMPHLPLKAYEDLKAFKLYLCDVGLLGCMSGISADTLLNGNELFVEFKGAMTEQYVFQELKALKKYPIYYYTNDRNTLEIDFVIDDGNRIIPIEAKAETNLHAKSLKTYRQKYQPECSVRLSMMNYKAEDGLINIPLYAISMMDEIKKIA